MLELIHKAKTKTLKYEAVRSVLVIDQMNV